MSDDLPEELEEGYLEAMRALEDVNDGVVVDHYDKQLSEFVATLPSSVRGRYTMSSLMAAKREYTAKEFMWLTAEQRLNFFRYGTTDGLSDLLDGDWED